eukprot:scaffold269807_cov35-Tisochrysis_lutea.AAC.1
MKFAILDPFAILDSFASPHPACLYFTHPTNWHPTNRGPSLLCRCQPLNWSVTGDAMGHVGISRLSESLPTLWTHLSSRQLISPTGRCAAMGRSRHRQGAVQ